MYDVTNFVPIFLLLPEDKRDLLWGFYDNRMNVIYLYKIAKLANLKLDYPRICQICNIQKGSVTCFF